MHKILLIGLALWLPMATWAQKQATLSGYIKDKATGEELLGATVFVAGTNQGTVTNAYGFYSLTLPVGQYELVYTFLGYAEQRQSVQLRSNTKLDVDLSETSQVLGTVTVTADRPEENINRVEMSMNQLPMKLVRNLPAFMGEVDVIKTLFYLPGVSSGGEGNSGIYVRGGGPDQNLILLDEAPVYNASHLLGFFSVFNSDVIKDMKIYKGGIPAQYGGRLSSLIDIRMKEGNNRQFTGGGGIGLLSSRLNLEIPLVKDKSAFIIAGRRTYADLFLKLHPEERFNSNTLYFYDLNAKWNYTFSENDRIFLTAYFGRDVFSFNDRFGLQWGNYTTTLRWNHLFGPRLFSNLTLLYSNYDYNLGIEEGPNAFNWNSHLKDLSAKIDFTFYANPNNTVRFGLASIYHTMEPGELRPANESFFKRIDNYDTHALEHGAYLSNEQKIGTHITLQYGLRLSLFQHIGQGTVFLYDDPQNPTNETIRDSLVFSSFEPIDNFWGFEPRISVNWRINDLNAIKASYNRNFQYLHLVTNTSSPTPFDIWVPTSRYIAPQRSDQGAIGYFRNLLGNTIEASAEVYYKVMDNQIDYRDGANLFLNKHIETEMLRGQATSYGLELMLKRNQGRFTGWLSYTLSRTTRQIEGVNNNQAYPSSFDRTHDVSVISSYEIDDRWSVSASWVFSTGSPTTFPVSKFEYEGTSIPIYSDRNSYRLPAYHRLDLGATYTPRANSSRRWKSSWAFSLFNVYARRNAYSISFQPNDLNPALTEAVRLSIIGTVIPSVTYNFNF